MKTYQEMSKEELTQELTALKAEYEKIKGRDNMNCLEAQSKIMAFIENKLPDDELREFIKHVRSCKNCYEELDIYYTLIVGMKQLDESDNISTDFKNALDRHLDEEMNRLTTVKRIANSTIMVVIVLVVSGLIWLYSGVLDKVYNYEQTSKLSEQSEYYYQDFFGSRLLNDEEYDVSDIDKYYIEINTTQDETTDFMKRVHKYNLSHKGMNSL